MILDLLNSFYEVQEKMPEGSIGTFWAGAVDEEEAQIVLGFLYPDNIAYISGQICKTGDEIAAITKKTVERHIEPKLLFLLTTNKKLKGLTFDGLLRLTGAVWLHLLEKTDAQDREEIINICESRQQTLQQKES